MKNSPEEELIPFRAFQNNFEAQVAKSKLEANGIESFLSGEIMGQLLPGSLIFPSLGAVKLWIRGSDEHRANELLECQEDGESSQG
jgi:hypothetical protein